MDYGGTLRKGASALRGLTLAGWFEALKPGDQLEKHKLVVPKMEAAYKSKLPALRDWLIEVVRHGHPVTYGEVMEAFGIDRFSLRHGMDLLGHQANDLGEPIITAFIVGKRTRRCSDGFAKEFGIHDDEAERRRLREYWSDNRTDPARTEKVSTDPEVKAARFASVEVRPDQAAFRRRVHLACNGRCVISGCDVEKALDAAHKTGREWRLGHNRAEDGYLMRKDLHALYDNKLLRITDDGYVNVDPSVMTHYEQFAGIRILQGIANG